MESVDVAIAYHITTKHDYHRFARSLGYLDWATQPDPFRRYAGAPLFLLPFADETASPSYHSLYAPGFVPPAPVTAATIGAFFHNSLALSAWKEYRGSRWSLRCNPSSGNLHPTEGYLIAGPVPGLHDRPAVYHYAPREHGLERRGEFSVDAWLALVSELPPGAFLAGLSSIHWREAWKYGERAWRYCQHDAGHAMAAVVLAAAMQGWCCVHLEGMADADAAALMGLDRDEDYTDAEREEPDLIVAVFPAFEVAQVGRTLPAAPLNEAAAGMWQGKANRLSREHVEWPVIDHVTAACRKPRTNPLPVDLTAPDTSPPPVEGLPAQRVFQQRRSAVDMDGRTSLTRETFYAMLRRTVPALTPTPWSTLGGPIGIHLGLFVHRVPGVMPGLYALVRDLEALLPLRRAMNPDFLWEKPKHCPPHLPLYVLEYGDFRDIAAQVSCGQDIAGDGAFSLGMIADFRRLLDAGGSWFYRRLFWEAGMVGQVLYLEAEAAGVRATGIGCYFDDPVHAVFGLQGLDYQSLYHFTVGGPVDDPRLVNRPAYDEARRTLAPGWRGQ